MEHLISKLLEDFERGKLTRRQLVRSLALAAAAAPAASSASPLQAIAINHISYQVHDYRKTRDFYADLLGMKVTHDTGKQCSLLVGDSVLIARNHGANTPRIDHVAYTVGNWERHGVEAELKRRGLQPRADTENSFHVKDPNGFDLQIAGREMKV